MLKSQKLLLFCSLASMTIALTSCNALNINLAKDSLLTVNEHIVKRVPVYSDLSHKDTPITSKIIHYFNGSVVPYIALGDTLSEYCKNLWEGYFSYSQDGTTFTVTNGIGSWTVDFVAQTIQYVNYDGFRVTNTTNYIPDNDFVTSGGKQYFIKDKSYAHYEGANAIRTIYLKKYNIPIYFDNDEGYVPLEVFQKYLYSTNSVTFSYNGSYCYFGQIKTISDAKIFGADATIYNDNYMEYTYNLLAMNVDNFFGLDKRNLRSNRETVYEYLPSDIYTLLEPYHDDLVSTKANVSYGAAKRFFAKYLDDGGHTVYKNPNSLCDDNYTDSKYSMYGDESNLFIDISQKLNSARKDADLTPSKIVSAQLDETISCTHCYQELDGVAYLTFDEFSVGDTIPSEVNINNYYRDTISLVRFANDQIRAHNIKNLIIDISQNGGGAIVAENFIASWICNGITTVLRNTKDHTFIEEKNYADIDLNGIYDSNDYLPSDVNTYCITSGESFSCGNLLPWHLKEQSKTKFIGAITGGGSCGVENYIPTGLGNFYTLSSPNQFGSIKSTSYDDFKSCEDWVSPNLATFTYDEVGIKKFYDHEYINSLIKGTN